MNKCRKNPGLRKLVAFVLVLAMVLTMMPTSAFAAKPGAAFGWMSRNFTQPQQTPAPEPEAPAEEPAPAAEPEAPAEDPAPAEEPEAPSEEPAPAEEPEAPAAEPAAEPEAPAAAPAPAEEPAEEPAAIAEELKVDDLTVSIEAEAGAFPEGVEVTAEKADLKDVQKAVDEAEDVDGKVLYAVDITFTLDGEELQPAEGKAVKVSFRADDLKDVAEDATVVHIDAETEKAEKVDTVKAEEDDEVAFEAEKFSVYAVIESVVPRLEIVFKNGDTTLDTMYIKASDTAAEVEDIIYDPGTGTMEEGQMFRGWTTEQNYTSTSELKSIQEVRSAAMTTVGGLTEDDSITYYAAIFNHFNVIYTDGEVTLGIETVYTPGRESAATYTVSMNYPTDSTHDLEGWIVAEGGGHIDGYPENAHQATLDGQTVNYYKNDETISVTGDVTFSVNAPEGHWLVFDENGKGATYNAPQFVKAGETTSDEDLLDMVRNGYTFGGWYTDAACTDGNEFTFGDPLETNTTIYAKWTAITTASYTVIIWKQNINGTDTQGNKIYDFEEAVRVNNAAVNSTPSAVNANTGAVSGASYSGQTGFHFEGTDQASKTVAPEGNTVVNVYWDRTEYTLTFKTGQGNVDYTTKTYNGTTYQFARVNNNTYYVQLDGKWYRVTGDTSYLWDNNIQSNNSHQVNMTPGGTFYVRSGFANTWRTLNIASTESTFTDSSVVKTITALYQQDILLQFPIVGSNGVTYNNGERWQPVGNTSVGNGNNSEVIVSLPSMPAENISFTLNTANRPLKTMYYYVEALPGDPVDITYDGKQFTLLNTISARYNWVRRSGDFTDIAGLEQYASDPEFGSDGRALVSSTEDQSINFYYTRKIYKINFMDGAYYDGNNNPLEETSRGQLREVDNILYGADLTSYNKGEDDFYTPSAPTGYVFEGWYVDSACTQAYTFTTMPEGITVYAKWRQIQYRVFLHSGVPESDTTLDWGSENQAMNFRISYGGKVSVPTGLRNGYEFFGWYEDEGLSKRFAPSTILNDSTVTTPYDKTTHLTDDMNKWGNIKEGSPSPTGGTGYNSDAWDYNKNTGIFTQRDRFWITREYNLYASWSAEIVGAKGIGVVYDANGGSGEPSDTALYIDNALASAGPAPTPPANHLFLHWVVQTWNGSAYVDTTETLLPGDSYHVLMSNAKVTDDNNGGAVVPLSEVQEDGKYHYTVQLKAVYKEIEEKTPTHIDWYDNYSDENDGKGAMLHSHTGITINEPVDILAAPSRNGYYFKGWSKIQGSTTAEFLAWDGTEYTTVIDGETYTVTQVAADEKQPYEDLFAVWEKRDTFQVVYASDVTLGEGNTGTISSEKVYTFYKDEFNSGEDGDTKPFLDVVRGMPDQEDSKGNTPLWNIYDGDTYNGSKWLYGGYRFATLADGTLTLGAYAEDVPGDKIVPDADKVYYVKNVNINYLSPYYKYTYVNRDKLVTGLWTMSILDDLNYSAAGFLAWDAEYYTEESTEGIIDEPLTFPITNGYKKITVNSYDPKVDDEGNVTYVQGKSVTVQPTSFYSSAGTSSRLIFVGIEDIFDDYFVDEIRADRLKAVFSFAPYWVTKDGIPVVSQTYKIITIHPDAPTETPKKNTQVSSRTLAHDYDDPNSTFNQLLDVLNQ